MLLALLSALLVHLFTALATSCWKSTQCTGPAGPSFKEGWKWNLFPPREHRVRPKSIRSFTDGDFVSDHGDHGIKGVLKGINSAVIFDFSFEVCGLVGVKYSASGPSGAIGLAFTESKL